MAPAAGRLLDLAFHASSLQRAVTINKRDGGEVVVSKKLLIWSDM